MEQPNLFVSFATKEGSATVQGRCAGWEPRQRSQGTAPGGPVDDRWHRKLIRWIRHSDDTGGRPGGDRLQPIPIRRPTIPDEELRAILRDARLRDSSPGRLAPVRDRRPGTA
jgi:hypothetical protein